MLTCCWSRIERCIELRSTVASLSYKISKHLFREWIEGRGTIKLQRCCRSLAYWLLLYFPTYILLYRDTLRIWKLTVAERKIRPTEVKTGPIKRIVRILQVCWSVLRPGWLQSIALLACLLIRQACMWLKSLTLIEILARCGTVASVICVLLIAPRHFWVHQFILNSVNDLIGCWN